LTRPISLGHAMNAIEHVAGYFKNTATETEKMTLKRKLEKCRNGALSIDSAKRYLFELAQTHPSDYLVHSYYFVKKEQLTINTLGEEQHE